MLRLATRKFALDHCIWTNAAVSKNSSAAPSGRERHLGREHGTRAWGAGVWGHVGTLFAHPPPQKPHESDADT
jgi:hypothetical protein